MNRGKKSKWLILLVVLLALLVFSVWYMRPITIYDLEQDFHPRAIAVSVIRVGTEPEAEQYNLSLREGEAGFDAFLPIRSVGQSGKEIGDALVETITRLSA